MRVLRSVENCVAAKEFVRTFTYEDYLNSLLSTFLVKEPGGNCSPVSEQIIEKPGDVFQVLANLAGSDRYLSMIRANVLGNNARVRSLIDLRFRKAHADSRDLRMPRGQGCGDAGIQAARQ